MRGRWDRYYVEEHRSQSQLQINQHGHFVCSYNQDMATWDEPKRLRNLEVHGLDFVGCETVFDGPVVTWEDVREAYGEQRINLLGWLNGIVVQMTYTERGDEPHVISIRKAEKHEIRRYAKEVSG